MPGYESQDGKIRGNRQLVESHDASHGKRSKHMGMEKVGRGEGQGGDENRPDNEGHDEIKAVVAEHGPAHTHKITKGKDGGHHSETHHETGHVHHAEHETLADAHEHGLQAMGGDDASSSSMLPMDEEEGAEHARAEHNTGFMGGM